MKKTFLMITFFIVTTNCLNAQAQNNNEQTKVNQTIIDFFDKLAKLDTVTIKQYSTSDFLLLEDGKVWNMDTLTSKIKQLKAVTFNRINHLDFIQTEVKGNTAWAAYNNAADMTINGQKMNIQWLESAFLIKDGKDWKIRLLHSTMLKPKAE